MNRRQLLSCAGASVAASFLPRSGSAALQCTPFNQQGIQLCQAGLQIAQFRTAEQQCANWCWAACVQTIFLLNGYHVDQRSIVGRLYPSLDCLTATGYEIATVTSGSWTDIRGHRFHARVNPLLDLSMGIANSNASSQVASELAAGRPLINGALGHATVLTAMTYLRDQFGRGQPQEIVVRDPWPFRQNRRFLTAQEAQTTFFIAAVHIA